jgi:hypothetical protein
LTYIKEIRIRRDRAGSVERLRRPGAAGARHKIRSACCLWAIAARQAHRILTGAADVPGKRPQRRPDPAESRRRPR